MNGHLSEGEVSEAHKYMNETSAFLVIRELHIETALRFHFASGGVAVTEIK